MSRAWTISLFAGLAERMGCRALSPEWAPSSLTVREIKQKLMEQYPLQADLLAVCFMARNQAYANDDTLVDCEDELALLPPVSGGSEMADHAMEVQEAPYRITDEPIDVTKVLGLVAHPDHGASIAFIGTTREWTHGRRTMTLEYEAYVPMAESALQQIGDEIAEKWPGTLCAIWHRIGTVGSGEISVVLVVSSSHRAEAYDASRFAIESLKRKVPIWKKELYEDGTEWKGQPTGDWNPLAPVGDGM